MGTIRAMEEQSTGGAAARKAARPRRARYDAWDATRVRALRRHLGYTQQQLSDELGTRQQTVSEWETGMYQPRGASARLLSLIAERAGFGYGAESGDGQASGAANGASTSGSAGTAGTAGGAKDDRGR
jgi:DNA-binding transcriptional regulator YiaG